MTKDGFALKSRSAGLLKRDSKGHSFSDLKTQIEQASHFANVELKNAQSHASNSREESIKNVGDKGTRRGL